MKPLIAIDSREQKQDYIAGRLNDQGIDTNIVCLAHGMDYLIVGTQDSVGIQRKTFPEVATQMQEIYDDILPALMDLTEHPVLLIEETYAIDNYSGMMMRRENRFLKPCQLSARSYFNFLNSVRKMGVEVITTKGLDESIWWMYSTHYYVHDQHYPHQKKRYGADMQALGMLCCINGIGHTRASQILQEHSLQDLITMANVDIIKKKIMTINQTVMFRNVIQANVKAVKK
ncbi:ERCC4 domain-containing protein [Methanoregula sp.]|uniref:ERCC4 domain-containing protein n=1 Tax=Methanoregula sp. TaxID=2052170 RepID=UPI0025CD806A|nr:ERCC4 domain-containing protein [Methanoregula sp.]